LLKELKAPESSQVLVFSKTSLQRERISPHNPRSLFFTDDTYVGFIPGAPIMEVTSVDPKLGAVFYTLQQKKVERPKFVRNDQCLECHASAKSMGVPGHLVRSFATDEAGVVDLSSGTSQVNHRTPFAERWGGWYVTGKHGQETHRGNLIGPAAFERQLKEPNYLGNIVDLSTFLKCRVILKSERHRRVDGSGTSNAHAELYRAFELRNDTRIAAWAHQDIRRAKPTHSSMPSLHRGSTTEEPGLGSPELSAPLPRGHAIARAAPLRDFDLRQRLFKHPCSYLIYSNLSTRCPGR
jgi:hypothetical protein